MKLMLPVIALSLIAGLFAPAQNSSTPAASNPSQEQPGSGAEAAKPAAAKGKTLIGCLAGPDTDGKYTLRSMTYRAGVEVRGPDGLKTASGSKVKLTGEWNRGEQPTEAGSTKKVHKFEATAVEVMAAKCEAPIEKTPISKEKQQRQQQKQQQQKQQQQQQPKENGSATPPATGDATTPK